MTSRSLRLKSCLLGSALFAFALPALAMAQPAYPVVTQSRLDNAAHSKGWLMFNRSYAGDDYAPFAQITPKNVGSLKEVWSSPKVDIPNGFEDAPVINGDYMFVTTPLDHIMAFNAKSGKLLWKYDYTNPQATFKTLCCDTDNRGVAVYDDMVFMGTLDNHMLAFDAKTGKLLWNTALEEPGIGYSITGAPLVVDGKVIIGSGGGEYGARGFIVGLDAKTGKLAWKLYTIPSPAEPGGKTWPAGAYKHGGGSPWMTGTYDPATKTLFWGVGNPGPWLATMRPGKNLYSDSLLAMNPATGKIKWHYQYTRNDTWDYDGVNTPQLTNIKYEGKSYKAIIEANRNGYFYAINRLNGKLIYAKPFVNDTSILGIDKTGHAINNPKTMPALDKQIFTCPSFLGGKNWWPGAVDPQTNMAYVPTLHACMTMKGVPTSYAAGLPYLGETFEMKPDPATPNELGSLQAIDLSTGKQVWQFTSKEPWDAGAMATSGGLVFSGTTEGTLDAFDAKTGKLVWTSPNLGSGIIADPVSYEIDGKQYIAIWSGWGGVWPLWSGKLGASLATAPRGGQLHVFALND
ncbi:MAG: methanol/ethanol family PQQ-dependent dehydrogenase [Acidiphilium sp.]|nr:methanol/ethanol family PQQ-dependent dehydrogenase [Acidiphilium sp.]MDD4935018.1 methanol/ethanol family PQQ-dependent dehydrogenase [Acidiphilium sp.]